MTLLKYINMVNGDRGLLLKGSNSLSLPNIIKAAALRDFRESFESFDQFEQFD
jgi:hypothetical protein